MLIGRATELARGAHALATSRLVTVWGPGGVGKSSLARELAAMSRRSGADVFSIGLRDVAPSLDGLLSALSRELELESPRPALSVIARALEAREAPLLLVDEGESAIEPLGRIVSDLLSRTANVRILVTSRALLGLAEEYPFELAPLARHATHDTAAASTPAGELFLTRARTLHPHFEVSPETLALVLACTEGIPLAIELMAADCATLPEDAIVRQMPSSLDSTIERSWNRLGAIERESLVRLSTFSGGFSPAAAAAILGPDLGAGLSSLRRQSLVLAEESSSDGSRFRLLTAVRSFARARADAASWQKAIRAHAGHFADVARTTNTDRGLVEELLSVADRAAYDEGLLPFAADAFDALVDKLTVDLSTVRSLIDRVLKAYPESTWVPRLMANRALVAEAQGDLTAANLELDAAEEFARTRHLSLDPYVSIARAHLAHDLSDTKAARGQLARLLGEDMPARVRGRAFAILSAVEYVEGNLEEALRVNELALVFSREAKDERAEHRSTLRLAFGLLDAGHPARALTELDLFTTGRTPLWQRALAATYRGNTLRRLGNLDAARASHEVAISLFRQASSLRWEGTARMDAGITELVDGQHKRAAEQFRMALAIADEVTDVHLQELISGYLAIATALEGDVAAANVMFERERSSSATATAARSTEIHLAHVRYLSGTATRNELERAMWPGSRAQPSPTEHIRWAITLATRSLERREPPLDALILEEGRVRLPDRSDWVDLTRKPTLERLLGALAQAHPSALSVSQLLAVGWPEVKLQRAAAENRLRVALSALRSLHENALKNHLLHDKEGYRLHPTLRIIDYRGAPLPRNTSENL